MVNKKCHCEICGGDYNKSYAARHVATAKHQKAANPTSEKPSIENSAYKSDNDESDIKSEISDMDTLETSLSEDEFLAELNNDTWKDPEVQQEQQKEEKKRQTEMEKLKREDRRRMLEDDKLERARLKLQKQSKVDEALTSGEIELLGRERHELLRRIVQYKTEFKTELKGIKVPKKNITVELLNKIIEECECILDLGGAQAFVMDGLFQSIRVVEGVSSMTKSWDISGLADALRKDPHFNSLCRRLYIRYGSFSQVDPLYQATFIVITSAYVMRTKNMQRKSMDAFLDERIPIPVNLSV